MWNVLLVAARDDPFTQKWLTGIPLRINLLVAFILLGIAMRLSLGLLANYDNWPIESVVIQYVILFIPWFSITVYPVVRKLQQGSIRKTVIGLLLSLTLISVFLLSMSMGMLARDKPLDPFGAIIMIYGLFGLLYLVRLSWIAGNRHQSSM